MAITLNTVAKQMTDPLRKGVIMNLLRYSDVLGILPWENVSALDMVVVRWQTLPDVGFRKINLGYTESSGETEQVTESIYILGGDVDADRIFDKITNFIEDPMVTQTNMKLKAIAFVFNDYFINGDPAVDADGFTGLKKRIDGLPSRQKFRPGSGTDAFDPTASSANEHAFIDGLHELDDLVGGADAFFCNRKLRLGVGRVLRRAGLLETSRDQWDRTVYEFNGAQVLDVGLKADKSTEIVTNTEDPGDGGDDTTSLYAVKFGVGDDALVGIQIEALEAYWVGGEDHELESKPVRRLRIDWPVGLAGFGDYYAARMHSIEDPANWT